MNQFVQQQRRSLMTGIGKIGKTNQLVDQLERKLAGYHDRRRTEQQLLNSVEEQNVPTKTKNTFKLFTKPQLQTNNSKMHMNELEVQRESIQIQGQGKVSELLQEVEAIEQLVRKKLNLKQERVAQLERQIELQKQQKIHLYKINTELEEQLNKLSNQNKNREKMISIQERELEEQYEKLKKLYQHKKVENKRLKEEEQLIKKTLKESQKNQKAYHEGEIKVIKNNSRSKLSSKRSQTVQQQQYLRDLAGELDKLRKMVKQKLKKSVSRSKR